MTRRGTPNVTLRIGPDLWQRFGDLTDDRSAILRAFVSWYVGEPGATMPVRPEGVAVHDWENDESPDALDAIRWEVNCLWSDLADATRRAANGGWSIQCENLVNRIVNLGRFVGALPWTQVQVDLLQSGAYERVYRGAGLEHDPIDWERLAKVQARISEVTRTATVDE